VQVFSAVKGGSFPGGPVQSAGNVDGNSVAVVTKLLASADNLQGLPAARAGLGVFVEGSIDSHLGSGHWRGILMHLDKLTFTREVRHAVMMKRGRWRG